MKGKKTNGRFSTVGGQKVSVMLEESFGPESSRGVAGNFARLERDSGAENHV